MYTPSQEILQKYANVMINFALRWGKGIKKWDTVFLAIPECAKDFLFPLQETILKAGGHPIINYLPNGLSKNFFEHASDEQISFYAKEYKNGIAKQTTHRIRIISEYDKHELKDIDPAKIGMQIKANSKFRQLLDEKELNNKFSRTLCLFPTSAMAKEAKMTLEEYRKEVIKACYLDKKNPIAEWKRVDNEIKETINKLNKLKIEKVHIEGKEIDLHVKIGANRKRLGGHGCNIPSFEIFTSPDRKGTNGKIKFNQPLYRHSQLIEGIEIEFKEGKVIKFSATKNQKFLKEIFKIPNTDKLWEFSLTDKRHSRITKFMAETLFDENVGGKYGNTHVAIGKSFQDAYIDTEKAKSFKKSDRKKLGFNDSAEHIDIMSTEDRTVTATLKNGEKKVIYRDGQFTV